MHLSQAVQFMLMVMVTEMATNGNKSNPLTVTVTEKSQVNYKYHLIVMEISVMKTFG